MNTADRVDSFFGGLIFSIVIVTLCFYIGGCFGEELGERSGYIQCLQDMKKGNPPAYVLVEQPDGTTKWEGNKEKGK